MDKLLTQEETLDALRVSRTTLYTLRRQGKLPVYGSKGKLLFKQADIDAYLNSTRRG